MLSRSRLIQSAVLCAVLLFLLFLLWPQANMGNGLSVGHSVPLGPYSRGDSGTPIIQTSPENARSPGSGDVAAEATGRIKVVVRWEQLDCPASGIPVCLSRLWSDDELIQRTDEGGGAEFRDLAPGWVSLATDRARGEGVLVLAGATSQVELVVPIGLSFLLRVTDVEGNPLGGCAVSLSSRPLYRDSRQIGVTDGNGVLPIQSVEVGRYLSVRNAGFLPSPSIPLSTRVLLNRELAVKMERGGGRLLGRVLDRATSAPIVNATIMVGGRGFDSLTSHDRINGVVLPGPPALVRTSDGNGQFMFDDVPDGRIECEVCARGYCASVVFIDMMPSGLVEKAVSLLPGGRVEGLVVDEAGAALEEALVTASALGNTQTRNCMTDGRGRFRLVGLAEGEHRLEVRHRSGRHTVLDIQVPVTNEDLTLVAELEDMASVYVIDSQRNPLANWRVGISSEPPTQGSCPRPAPMARTDHDGLVRLARKACFGKYLVIHSPNASVFPAFMAPCDTVLAAGEVKLDSDSLGVSSVECSIGALDPLELGTVSVRLTQICTGFELARAVDEQGRVRFAELAPGDYKLDMLLNGMDCRAWQTIHLSSGEQRDLSQILLDEVDRLPPCPARR